MSRVSNPFTVQIVSQSNTALANAARGLTAGTGASSYVTFNKKPSFLGSESLTWVTAVLYYDANLNQVQITAKQASNVAYEHYVYNESTDQWGSNTNGGQVSFGHMWNTAFDWNTGTYYYLFYSTGELFRYRPGVGWDQRATMLTQVSGEALPGGLGWHPNLYGTGDGGLVSIRGTTTQAWRASTNGPWVYLQTGVSAGGYNGGSGAYDSVNDKVWVGTGQYPRAVIVSAGSGGSVGSVASGAYPVSVYGGSEGDSTGKVIPHPYTAGKLLCLHNLNNTVWASTNSGASWSSHSTHPFVTGNGQWTCGPIPREGTEYGVIWGMASRTSMSILWKPPA